MPLPKPVLDNRNFDQLVAEGRALIPRQAPMWTDHNTSDPGITLVELFAWLTEMDLFRLDRISDEQLRGFLRLVGSAPLPAQVAMTTLLLTSPVETDLPAGLQLGSDGLTALFQTTQARVVSSAQLVELQAANGDTFGHVNLLGTGFAPFAGDVAPGAAFHLGFDRALATAGRRLGLWVWTENHRADAHTRQRLIEEHARAVAASAVGIGCAPAEDAPWQHYESALRWEYHAGGDVWKALPGVADQTRALTLTGPIDFDMPADHALGGVDTTRFWLRAVWISGQPDCRPRLLRIGFNAVTAANAIDRPAVVLPRSQGRANALHDLGFHPVVPGSCDVSCEVGGVAEGDWQEVVGFDVSGAHDDHVMLDAERGRLHFGDGRRGRVPPAGAVMSVICRSGGGLAGNVAAHLLERWCDDAHNRALVTNWTTTAPLLAIEQPFAADLGAEAETLRAAIARVVGGLRLPSRATTLDDFESFARSVPGVAVARARALADHHPGFPCYRAAGNITVVIVPDCPGPRPMPTPGMCRAVLRYLELRRTPATEVHVIAPTYAEVRVVATVSAEDGQLTHRLRAVIVAALDRFLHPLHGGEDGLGWPVGRDVYRSEILALLARIPGIACVQSLGLQGPQDAEPRCANLPVCDDSLVVAGTHAIHVLGATPIRLVDRSIPNECP